MKRGMILTLSALFLFSISSISYVHAQACSVQPDPFSPATGFYKTAEGKAFAEQIYNAYWECLKQLSTSPEYSYASSGIPSEACPQIEAISKPVVDALTSCQTACTYESDYASCVTNRCAAAMDKAKGCPGEYAQYGVKDSPCPYYASQTNFHNWQIACGTETKNTSADNGLNEQIISAIQQINDTNNKIAEKIAQLNAQNDALEARLKNLTAKEDAINPQASKIPDLAKNRIYNNLLSRAKEHFGRDLTSDEIEAFNKGVLAWQGAAKNVKGNETAIVLFPKEAPIKGIAVEGGEPASNFDITLTSIDPAILKKTPPTPAEEKNLFSQDYALGAPDYPIPIVEPLAKQDFYKFFRVDAKIVLQEVVDEEVEKLFQERRAYFTFGVPKLEVGKKRILLARYDEKKHALIPKKTVCKEEVSEFSCNADPPVSGYYAILLEEPSIFPTKIFWSLSLLFWFGLLYYHTRTKKYFKAKMGLLKSFTFSKMTFKLGSLYLGLFSGTLLLILGLISGPENMDGVFIWVLAIFMLYLMGLLLGAAIGFASWLLILIFSKIFKISK